MTKKLADDLEPFDVIEYASIKLFKEKGDAKYAVILAIDYAFDEDEAIIFHVLLQDAPGAKGEHTSIKTYDSEREVNVVGHVSTLDW